MTYVRISSVRVMLVAVFILSLVLLGSYDTLYFKQHHNPTPLYIDMGFDLIKVLNPPTRAFSRGGAALQTRVAHSSSQALQRRMDERMSRVRKKCKHIHKSADFVFERYRAKITLNQLEGLYMCRLPKASFSVWSVIMLQLAGFLSASNTSLYQAVYQSDSVLGTLKHDALKRARQREPHSANYRYSDTNGLALEKAQNSSSFPFFGWTQMRHPFERLVSCYRDKVVFSNYFRSTLYLRRPSDWPKQPEAYPIIPSFAEFIDYVIFMLTNKPQKADFHYTPHFQLCQPCLVNYDYIILYENLPDEANFVLEKTGHANRIRYPVSEGKHEQSARLKGVSTVHLMKQYYVTLTLHQIQKLYYLYQYDFELYEYD